MFELEVTTMTGEQTTIPEAESETTMPEKKKIGRPKGSKNKKPYVYKKPEVQPDYGRGGKYNWPNAGLKKLEDDDTKRELIGKALHNILTVSKAFDMPPKSDEEVCDRLNWFFQTCADTNQIPTVEKMCLALSWDRQSVSDIISGKRPGLSSVTGDILKKAKTLIASLDAELALDSKIQPVVYMFRAKNYYGMKDVQDVEIAAKPLAEKADQEYLEAKYKELPED